MRIEDVNMLLYKEREKVKMLEEIIRTSKLKIEWIEATKIMLMERERKNLEKEMEE